MPKKKSFEKDHISLNKFGGLRGPNGDIFYTPVFTIPPPFHAWCHPCNKGFMSIDEITKHDHKIHDTGYIGNKD